MRPALVLVLLSCVAAGRVCADGTPYRRASLIENSPFSVAKSAESASGAPLELRGFFGDARNPEVSLARRGTGECAWVRTGDRSAKWYVETADIAAGTAVVHCDGRTLRLALAREARPAAVPGAPEGVVKISYERTGPDTRGEWGVVPEEKQRAFRAGVRDEIAKLKVTRPEYFDGSTLTPEKDRERREEMRAAMERARAALASGA